MMNRNPRIKNDSIIIILAIHISHHDEIIILSCRDKGTDTIYYNRSPVTYLDG